MEKGEIAREQFTIRAVTNLWQVYSATYVGKRLKSAHRLSTTIIR